MLSAVKILKIMFYL